MTGERAASTVAPRGSVISEQPSTNSLGLRIRVSRRLVDLHVDKLCSRIPNAQDGRVIIKML